MTSDMRHGQSVPGADWFNTLSPELQRELEGCMTRRRLDAGQAIYLEGDKADSMFRIVSGRVRVRSLSSGGREVLMMIYGPGHCIGTVSLLDGLPRHTDAVTECATTLDMVRAADFHRIGEAYPGLYKSIAVSYAMWIRDHHTMFADLSIEERLARRLDFLLDFGAASEDASGALRLNFTQEMLASSVAVSRQTISKLLQEWQDSGVIDYKYGSVWVLNRGRLRQLATRRLN